MCSHILHLTPPHPRYHVVLTRGGVMGMIMSSVKARAPAEEGKPHNDQVAAVAAAAAAVPDGSHNYPVGNG